MNPKHAHIITFCSQLEQKLDAHLFRSPEDEETGTGSAIRKGVLTAGGAAYGGSVLKRALSPMVADRRSGMRAMIPGFTQKSGLGQTVAATGTVLRDKPLAALRSVGRTVAGDAAAVGRTVGRPFAATGRMVAGVGKTVASEAVKTARAVPGALGMMGRDVARMTSPLLARLRGLAGKFGGKV